MISVDMRFLAKLKKELYYLRKAVFVYRAGACYLYDKYSIAPKIRRSQRVFSTENPAALNDLSLHILTGHTDLVMALWSLVSFFTQTSIRGNLYVHNDGSLRQNDFAAVNRLFPQAIVISPKEAAAAVSGFYRKCPNVLRLRRTEQFVLLKKLLDPLAVSKSRMLLVIDSDLVWFKKPQELEAALSAGLPHPVMMQNSGANYVRFSDGSAISEAAARFNSGIVAFRPENFSLPKLEEYLGMLDFADPQTPHFIEQAGYAVALSGTEILPEARYTIKGSYSDELALRHYTSPRRPLFYLEALPKLRHLV